MSNLLFSNTDNEDIPAENIDAEQLEAVEERRPSEAVINNVPEDNPITLKESLALAEADEGEIVFKEIKIKNGQGLMDALVDSGAQRTDAFNAIETLSDHFNVRRIQVGQKFDLAYTPNGILSRIQMQKDLLIN